MYVESAGKHDVVGGTSALYRTSSVSANCKIREQSESPACVLFYQTEWCRLGHSE